MHLLVNGSWVCIRLIFYKILLLGTHPLSKMVYFLLSQNDASILLLRDIKLYGGSIKIVHHDIQLLNKSRRRCPEKYYFNLFGIEYQNYSKTILSFSAIFSGFYICSFYQTCNSRVAGQFQGEISSGQIMRPIMSSFDNCLSFLLYRSIVHLGSRKCLC